MMVKVPKSFVDAARAEYDRRMYCATFEAFLKTKYGVWVVYCPDGIWSAHQEWIFHTAEEAVEFKLKYL